MNVDEAQGDGVDDLNGDDGHPHPNPSKEECVISPPHNVMTFPKRRGYAVILSHVLKGERIPSKN